MRWYHYIAYFFGAFLLTNALPHLGNGITGHAFQTPFAHPPAVGLSPARINVLWGSFNLLIGYLLICRVGTFNLRDNRHIIPFGAGFLASALALASMFGPLHGGQ